MKVRCLYLVNLEEIIRTVEKSVIKFMNETGIDLVNDLTNLFISRVFLEMSEVYRNQHEAFVSFFINSDMKVKLLDCDGYIKYKRFFKIMEKEVKFPIITANISYSSFCKMMKEECPEYDEVVANHRSFSEIFSSLVKVIKRAKFHRLGKEVVEDLTKRCELLMSL